MLTAKSTYPHKNYGALERLERLERSATGVYLVHLVHLVRLVHLASAPCPAAAAVIGADEAEIC